MKHIKEIAAHALASIKASYACWKFERETKERTEKKSTWIAGATGGLTLELGYLTRREAMREISHLDLGTIIYVDDDACFIAVRSPGDQTR